MSPRDGRLGLKTHRELSIIRRGFTLAKQSEPPVVHRVPYMPKLEEDNVRQGFLEPDQYEKVLVELPQRLTAPLICACHVGTRKGELRKVSGRRSISMPGSST